MPRAYTRDMTESLVDTAAYLHEVRGGGVASVHTSPLRLFSTLRRGVPQFAFRVLGFKAHPVEPDKPTVFQPGPAPGVNVTGSCDGPEFGVAQPRWRRCRPNPRLSLDIWLRF